VIETERRASRLPKPSPAAQAWNADMANPPVLKDGQVDFRCTSEGFCTCGAKIRAGYANDHPTVLHPMPMCKTFEAFESPIDYLRYVNNTFERRGKG
jgi:hypothetical protein